MTLYHLTLQSAYMQYHRCTVLPESGYDVGPRVEAGHTVLPERLAMMLVAVEEGHVVGHVLSISLVQ